MQILKKFNLGARKFHFRKYKKFFWDWFLLFFEVVLKSSIFRNIRVPFPRNIRKAFCWENIRNFFRVFFFFIFNFWLRWLHIRLLLVAVNGKNKTKIIVGNLCSEWRIKFSFACFFRFFVILWFEKMFLFLSNSIISIFVLLFVTIVVIY